MVAKTQNFTKMTHNQKIDRCIAIEEEYDSLQNIHLTYEDIEDVSERYQAKLELQWHRRDLEDEYSELNKELGYPNRKLSVKSSRRIL